MGHIYSGRRSPKAYKDIGQNNGDKKAKGPCPAEGMKPLLEEHERMGGAPTVHSTYLPPLAAYLSCSFLFGQTNKRGLSLFLFPLPFLFSSLLLLQESVSGSPLPPCSFSFSFSQKSFFKSQNSFLFVGKMTCTTIANIVVTSVTNTILTTIVPTVTIPTTTTTVTVSQTASATCPAIDKVKLLFWDILAVLTVVISLMFLGLLVRMFIWLPYKRKYIVQP